MTDASTPTDFHKALRAAAHAMVEEMGLDKLFELIQGRKAESPNQPDDIPPRDQDKKKKMAPRMDLPQDFKRKIKHAVVSDLLDGAIDANHPPCRTPKEIHERLESARHGAFTRDTELNLRAVKRVLSQDTATFHRKPDGTYCMRRLPKKN
jgi:hypothetical protein